MEGVFLTSRDTWLPPVTAEIMGSWSETGFRFSDLRYNFQQVRSQIIGVKLFADQIVDDGAQDLADQIMDNGCQYFEDEISPDRRSW